MDAAEHDLDQYLERVAGIDRTDLSTHLARGAIIEQATILDYAVNELLALPLAVDQAAANVLAFDIFARIANDVRVGMLETLMKDHDLVDLWPFVLPVLRRVFGLRNRLSHGFVERGDDGRIQITSYNRAPAARPAVCSGDRRSTASGSTPPTPTATSCRGSCRTGRRPPTACGRASTR